MGRRKARKEIPETLTENERSAAIVDEELEEDDSSTGSKGRFFACYLLTSLCPRFKGHTYIGFTVNPKRRIRQHNGEIGSGAWRTKRKRPWEMVLCIYGFPTNVTALQFEWAWQHPVESLAVRKAAANFKSLSGLANKIKLAYAMVTLPEWQSLNLTVNFFSTKYRKHVAGCPPLPKQMKVQVCSLDELPCYTGSIEEDDDVLYASSEEGCLNSADEREMDAEIDHFLADRLHSHDDSERQRCNTSQEVALEPDVRTEEACFQPSFQLYDEFIPSPKSSSPNMMDNGEENRTWKLDSSKNCPVTNIEDTDATTYHPPWMSKEVEIIDVFTPSPCNKASTANKKRRLSASFPEIIDLTESPMFV